MENPTETWGDASLKPRAKRKAGDQQVISEQYTVSGERHSLTTDY